MAQVAIFKEISDQVRKDLDQNVLSGTKTSQRLIHYIYYLATDNIRYRVRNDNTVLIKGLKKVVKMLNSFTETRASYRNVL